MLTELLCGPIPIADMRDACAHRPSVWRVRDPAREPGHGESHGARLSCGVAAEANWVDVPLGGVTCDHRYAVSERFACN